MSDTCQAVPVMVDGSTGGPSMDWMAIGFFIGLLIGLIVGIVIAYILVRKGKKNNRQLHPAGDGDAGDYTEASSVDETKKTKNDGLNSMIISYDNLDPRRKKEKVEKKKQQSKELHLEDYGIIPMSAVYKEGSDAGAGRPGGAGGPGGDHLTLPGKRGLMDALVKPSGGSVDLELANQDLDVIAMLEKDIRDGKILNFNQLAKMLLAHFAQIGSLSPESYKQLCDDLREAIVAILKHLHDEQTAEISLLENDVQQKQDPLSVLRAREIIRHKYAQKLDALLSQQQQNIRSKLTSMQLSDDDVDSAMTRLNAGLTACEDRVSQQIDTQKKTIVERLLRRKMIAETRQNKHQENMNQLEAATAHYKEALYKIVSDGRLLDRKAEELLSEYHRTLLNVQRKHDDDQLRQMELLAAGFQTRRLQQLVQLEEVMDSETEQMLLKYGDKSDMAGYIQAYHKMKLVHQEKRDTLIDDMDQEELIENGKSMKPLISDRKQGIREADQVLMTSLRDKHGLDEAQINDLINEHKTRMTQFEARKKKERQIMENEMSVSLAKRMQALDGPQTDDNVRVALKERQQEVIKQLLAVQPDLDDEARKKILLSHERNVRALDNQIVMSRMRQQKLLEARMAEKGIKLNKIHEKMAAAGTDGAVKVILKLEQKLAKEEAALAAEREKAAVELRQRIHTEAEAALKAQETEMCKLIGILQVGKARRQAIKAQQDHTLIRLEERMAKERGLNVPEQLMQQHYDDLLHLQQSVQAQRQQQEMLIRDQIEAQKYMREREIEAKLAEQRRQTGSTMTSPVVTHIRLEQLHHQLKDEMIREMKLELQKQKVKLDGDYERELQEAMNDLTTNLIIHLAAVSDMTKEDVKNMVNSAAAESGADAKRTKSLTRRLTLGMESAKTALSARSQGRRKGSARTKTSLGLANHTGDKTDSDDEAEPRRHSHAN